MFKKTISTHALALLLIGGGMAFTQTSCNRGERQESIAESRDSYQEFQNFVTDTEARAGQVGNLTEAEYNEESTQLKSDYDTRVAAAEADMANWDDTRRTEYEQLKSRYTTAYDRREQAYRSRGTMSAGGTDVAMNTNTTSGSMDTDNSMSGSTTGSSMAGGSTSGSMSSSSSMNTSSASSGAMMPMNMAAGLTAANARQTYERFVNMVKENENRYQIADWRQINSEWRALDQKYERIKDDVSGSDKREIAKEKAKYAAFKSYDKAESRVSQGADLVTGDREEAAAKGSGVQLERSGKNAASDVKEVGKDIGQGAVNVGQKVGSTAKGAYKEVKSEIKNTDND